MKVSKTIIFIVISLVMLNNVEHLAWVHYTIANKLFPVVDEFDWLNKIHSVLVVIIFEIVVITFAIQGQKAFSLFFTFCIWVLSMIYYDAAHLIDTGQWQETISATVYATIFTVSIYMFSEMLAEWYQEERMVVILTTRLQEIQSEKSKLQQICNTFEASYKDIEQRHQQTLTELQQANAQLKTLNTELQNYREAEAKEKADLLCPWCKQYQAESPAQLRSHKGHCPDKPNKQ